MILGTLFTFISSNPLVKKILLATIILGLLIGGANLYVKRAIDAALAVQRQRITVEQIALRNALVQRVDAFEGKIEELQTNLEKQADEEKNLAVDKVNEASKNSRKFDDRPSSSLLKETIRVLK